MKLTILPAFVLVLASTSASAQDVWEGGGLDCSNPITAGSRNFVILGDDPGTGFTGVADIEAA